MVLPMAMGWRHLLFQNWPVDPGVVDAHLPEELEPDEHDGSAWLTVVPFTNVAVRPRGVPEALGVRLPELNLRTYVTREGVPGVYFFSLVTREGVPGVYFFSLDAQGVASVLGARALNHLPYYYARISLDYGTDSVQFRSRRRHPGARPARYEATYRPTGGPFASTADSLAEFLAERYRFYTQAQDGTVRYTNVAHDPWTLYPARVNETTNTLLSANGFEKPDAEPVCYYSPGLDVVTSGSKRL